MLDSVVCVNIDVLKMMTVCVMAMKLDLSDLNGDCGALQITPYQKLSCFMWLWFEAISLIGIIIHTQDISEKITEDPGSGILRFLRDVILLPVF